MKIFAAIIILASLLRLWALNNYPAGLNADEAAIGYNAYSLLQTGKDEYGSAFPLAFKSFGDYKPGLFVYIVMPFVALLGLNEWAVRLPSALLGIGTVILTFFLAKIIFKKESVALLATFLLAISPWHIHFSRGGWETNVATFFMVLGVLFYLKGLEKGSYLFWSLISFLASMYTYQSPRLIIPVFALLVIISYRKSILVVYKKLGIKKSITGFLILTILTIPLVLQFISGQGGARFTGLSFLSDPGPISRVNELRGEHDDPESILVKIEHNKLIAHGSSFLGHYLDHFRPDFFFIRGDPLIRNKVPETGQFYLVESLLLLLGLVALVRNKFTHTKILIAWILVAPLASAMTYQTPHALRALNMVVPLTLIMALGLWQIINSIKFRWFVILIALVLAFEFVHYLEAYYVHYPKRYPLAWEYGFKEMVAKLNEYESLYNKVVITDRYDQPYILLLFYKKYEPSKYQPQAVLSPRDKFNFGTIRSFDKYEFRSINAVDLSSNENVLFIGTGQEIPQDANIIDKVDFPNGEPAFLFVGSKK